MRAIAALAATTLLALGGAALILPGAITAAAGPDAARFAFWDRTTQRELAARQLEADSPEAAGTHARAALAAMPYDSFSLAVASIGQPDEQRVMALNLAAGLGWRDPVTNLTLIRTAIASGEATIAAQRIDALGRIEPNAPLQGEVDRLLALPGGSEALAERAHRRGKSYWWQGYLRSEPADATIAQQRADLVRRFDRQDGAWQRTAVRDAMIGFDKADMRALSLSLWRDTLADPERFSGMVYDPDFAGISAGASPLGSEWQVLASANARVEAAERGVVVSPLGLGNEAVLSQRLALPAGQYVLSVEGAGDGPFTWSLSCEGREIGLESGEPSPLGRWLLTLATDCGDATLALRQAGRGSDGEQLSLTGVSLEPMQ
ncbi:hypothetical protein [Erythrobacter sp. HKB08]|uniref:hypothetical protein n=1 Tax=Erythrobacter sp. HKB08 TaxID=2502843 RepID=UPI001008BA28|nr:hypothetical protein [Erythrobacter sp. HKB08]